MKYCLGNLVVGIRGSGLLHEEVSSEISESLLPSTAEPDVWFDFQTELPPMRYRRTGDIYISGTRLRIIRNGLVADIESDRGPLEVRLAPERPLTKGFEARVRRIRDWNYLDPAQTQAKNFMYDVFDWVTHLAQLRLGQSYIHASSMQKGDEGLAVLGWGGVGKSTSLLKLCLEEGWSFLSDDLGLVNEDGVLFRTPKRLQVYGYNVEGQPHIRHRLLNGRTILDRASWKCRLMCFGPQKVRRRVSAESLLGENRVARTARLTRIVYLERSSEDNKGIEPALVSEVANRMAAIVLSEIEPYSALHRQAVAAGSTIGDGPDWVQRRTAEVLESAFKHVPISYIRVGEQPSPAFVTAMINSQW